MGRGDDKRQPSSPTPPQFDAGECGDEGAEGVAADLEVAVLVVGGAGGGKEHDGLARITRLRIACRRVERRLERPAARKADLTLESGGELRAGLADQIRLGDA